MTSPRLFSLDLVAPETAGGMVVDDANGLHPGVDDRRPDEFEAAAFQLFGDLLRQGRGDDPAAAVALDDLSVGERPAEVVESFTLPITTYAQSHFVTGRAAGRHMIAQRSGVVLMHTPEPARVAAPLLGGMSPAWAAMESLNRAFSAEWAPHGVRAVCLRTTGMEETPTIDVVFGLHAKGHGITHEEFRAAMAANTHRKRATTLEELAEVAAFVASDRAAAMTGTVANLTGGIIVD